MTSPMKKAVYTADPHRAQFMLLRGLGIPGTQGMYGYAYARWYDGIVYAWGGNNTIYIQMFGTAAAPWGDHAPPAWPGNDG